MLKNMLRTFLPLTILFGAFLIFSPTESYAGSYAPMLSQQGGSFPSEEACLKCSYAPMLSQQGMTQEPNQFITTIGNQVNVGIETPMRSGFSFWTSVLTIIAGFWAMLILTKARLGIKFRFKNRFANLIVSPRLALTNLGIVVSVTIFGSWINPPTTVSAGDKHSFKLSGNADLTSAQQFGGEGTTQVGRPVFDKQGNQYLYGAFIGTLTVGKTTLKSTKDFDMFVAKLDDEGNLLWMRQGSGVTGGVPNELAIEAANSLAVDANGNVYVGGGFVKQMTLQGGKNPAAVLRDSGGKNFNYEPYLAKYNANGDLVWAKGGGSGSPQVLQIGANIQIGANVINQIVFDSAGNPYIAGVFSGTNFLGSAGKTAGSSDAVLAKINPASGEIIWKKIIGGNSIDNGLSLGIDGGNNLYLLVQFVSKSISISKSETFENKTGVDTLIAKFDSSGGNLWAQQLGGESFVMGNQLVVNAEGDVFVTGQFSGSLPIDTEEEIILTENENGSGDAAFGGFVAKLDENGAWAWAESFGGPGDGIALDENGVIYVTGTFFGDGDFDGKDSAEANFKSNGADDQFISAYNENGELEWAKAIPASGVNSESVIDSVKLGGDYKPLGAGFNPATQSIFITGDFSGKIDFGETELTTKGTSRHAFLAEVSGGE